MTLQHIEDQAKMHSIESQRHVSKLLSPEWAFAGLALVFGLILIFVNAPFQVPDESEHFLRAYHVSQGDFTVSRKGNTVGGWVPESVASFTYSYNYLIGESDVRMDRDAFWADFNRPPDEEKKRFVDFCVMSVYTPIIYMPQAGGILLGRMADWSALKIMYAGRISALLCWIAMIIIAIRIVPVFKWVFVLIALLPRSVSLAASLSADGPTNALALLLTAVLLREIFSHKMGLSNWDSFFIIALSVLLSMAKQVYLPLTGMVLLIPVQKFDGWKNKLFFCGMVIGAAALTSVLWSMQVRDLYKPWNADADAHQQMAYIMSRPWAFPGIAFETFYENRTSMRLGVVGVLGYLDTWLPAWIYRSYPIVLFAIALFGTEDNDTPFDWGHRGWIILLCTCSFLLIYFSMYLIWTVPGADFVYGVHSRYFLPLGVPALLALFYNQRFKIRLGYWGPLAVELYLCAVWGVTLWTVWFRFSGPTL